MPRTRSYTELRRFETFEDRFEYLRLDGRVGEETFGFDRYINQQFYRSKEWRTARRDVMVRDNGLDMGVFDHEIAGNILIHHIIPMTAEDIEDGNPLILDPDNLISVSHNTHNAIHYGDASLLPQPFVERAPGDTRPW